MNVDDILVEHGASVRALVDRSVDVDRALAETLGRPVDTVAPAPSPARRMRRLVAVAAVTVVAAVGIGSWLGSRSDPDRLVPTSPETTDLEPAPTTEPSPTTTAPVTDEAAEAVGEVGEVGRFTDGFSVTAAFEALPLRLSKLDGDDSFDRIGIVAADRDAVDDLAPGLELPFPWFPGLDGTATPEQRRSELGFDVTDADRYASMHDWATGYFGIYTGDQVRLGTASRRSATTSDRSATATTSNATSTRSRRCAPSASRSVRRPPARRSHCRVRPPTSRRGRPTVTDSSTTTVSQRPPARSTIAASSRPTCT